MNLKELSNLNNLQLNELLFIYDKWQFDEDKKQVYKNLKDTKLIFATDDFSPFTKPFQAEIILKNSSIDFSAIQQNFDNQWGLMVFQDNSKKYLILESDSKMKSSLLLLIAIQSGLLQK